MNAKRLVWIIWFSLSLMCIHFASAWALRCHGRIVSVGDRKYDVIARCGEPTWVETRQEVYAERHGLDYYGYGGVSSIYADIHRHRVIEIEEWTYNFGPHRLIYHLRFVDGVLERIWTGGHGFVEK